MKTWYKEIYHLLKTHKELYPLMELQDMVKLLYQNEFGTGHMVEREEKSLAFLQQEYLNFPHSILSLTQSVMEQAAVSDPVLTPIGSHLVRIDFTQIDSRLLPPLNRLFANTANYCKGTISSFEEKLLVLLDFIAENSLFEDGNAVGFLAQYKEQGYPALSHSAGYRNAYHPAYRVVSDSYIAYLIVFEKILTLMQEKETVTICIDGNCAAGKTTLSQFISDFTDCRIIHMDDFFLPPLLRTEERLSEPGGNIHYERFYQEVVLPLIAGSPLCFRRFSCKKMDYQDTISLFTKPLLIVEGSYSMRQEFREIYDYRIFVTCSAEEQIARIRKRNGEEMLSAFINKWIPMENKYFEVFSVSEQCDIVI